MAWRGHSYKDLYATIALILSEASGSGNDHSPDALMVDGER